MAEMRVPVPLPPSAQLDLSILFVIKLREYPNCNGSCACSSVDAGFAVASQSRLAADRLVRCALNPLLRPHSLPNGRAVGHRREHGTRLFCAPVCRVYRVATPRSACCGTRPAERL